MAYSDDINPLTSPQHDDRRAVTNLILDKPAMGRSVPAIIVASIAALFILPISLLLGVAAIAVLFEGVGLDAGGKIVGWTLFGAIHTLLIAIIAGMMWNRFRNIAANILGMSFCLGYLLAHAMVTMTQKFEAAGLVN